MLGDEKHTGARFESLPDLLQGIVDSIAHALEVDRITLITVDLKEDQIIHFVNGGPGRHQVIEVDFSEIWNGLSGLVMRELSPVLSKKDSPDPRETKDVQKRRAETNSGDIIVVPLIYRQEILGTMTAINRSEQRSFIQRDVDLMMALSQHQFGGSRIDRGSH